VPINCDIRGSNVPDKLVLQVRLFTLAAASKLSLLNSADRKRLPNTFCLKQVDPLKHGCVFGPDTTSRDLDLSTTPLTHFVKCPEIFQKVDQ
jgi:hypothetical protein